ncbi:3D domain-containing protein [Candidatus Uhrbacteria bacterium]|nr:3D domain-containing protein [Candidatus Uhrbacteria bacterium]
MKNKTIQQLKNLWEEDVAYTRTITTALYQAWVRVEGVFAPVRRQASSLSLVAFVLVVATYVLFPKLANADMEFENIGLSSETVSMIVASMQNVTEDYGRLPVAGEAPARRHYTIPITAYTSEVEQTDESPCITASGLDVCERDMENVVAANFLPLGTRVKIPELYGDRVFYVEDRMNQRYNYKMDIWMKDLADAKAFGVQYVTIEVF